MNKHDQHKGKEKQATELLSGIVGLLEHADGQLRVNADGAPCRKVSETIYQCLTNNSCRYKFPYETVRLCSWPNAGNPERTPENLPCNTDEKTAHDK